MKSKTVFLILTGFMASSLCHAVDYTWNGASIADWFDANNWSLAGVPDTNDTAIINSGDVLLNGDTTVAGLILDGGTLRGNGPHTIIITTNLTWAGSTLGAALTSTISTGGTMTITGGNDKVFGGCTLSNHGTVTWSGSGRLLTAATYQSTVNNFNGAVFEVQSTASIARQNGFDPPLIINNSGTFRKTGTGTTTDLGSDAANVYNTGTVEVTSGTLRLPTSRPFINYPLPFINTGVVWVQGGTLELGGGISSGVFEVGPAGILNFFNASFSHELNGATFTNHGTILFSGSRPSFNTPTMVPGNVILSEGNISGTNEVTFESLTWTGGRMSDNGVTTIAPSGTLMIGGSANKYLGGDSSYGVRTLYNYGTITLSSTGTLYFVKSVIHNATNAVFELQSDASILPQYYSDPLSLFLNQGTFRKAGGTNTSLFTEEFVNTGLLQMQEGRLEFPYFENHGTAQVASGILDLSYWSYNTGQFEVLSGAALQFNGGGILSHGLETNSVITGAGDLRFAGTTANLNGTNLISGSIQVAGGSANFNHPQSVGAAGVPFLVSSGAASINANATLPSVTISGGALGGTGEVTIPTGSVWAWTGGAMGWRGLTPGTTTIAPGGTLTISGNQDKYFQGRTLNNHGTITWSGNGRILSRTTDDYMHLPNTINNYVEGTFEAQSTASIEIANLFDPILSLNNTGVFRKTGPNTTTSLNDMSFINTGTVELRSGKLQVPSGGGLASAGTLRFVIGGPTAGVGYGQLWTGLAALDGNFSLSLVNGFRPTGCDTFELMRFIYKTGSFTGTNGLDLGGGLSFIMNFSDTNLTLITAAPQPCLSSVVSLTNGQFQFQIAGQVGSDCVIQASTDFTAWIPIATNVISANGFISFVDPFATNFDHRFYRAVAP